MMVLRVLLLVFALTASTYGILPEIVDSGISLILEDNSAQGHTALNPMFVEAQDAQQSPEDALQHQVSSSSTAESASPQRDKVTLLHNDKFSDNLLKKLIHAHLWL